jgi:SAM-dependent methyltransferase
MTYDAVPDFPDDSFARIDVSPDNEFYAQPRLVYHIDEYAVRAVGEVYRRFLTPGSEYLDLMSSWVSHLPDDFEVGRLVGHGMNEEELRANPRLTEYFLQDLNRDPRLPFEDDRFDGVLICVSVQYLTRPVEVFGEIGRVLKPGAPLIVTFSNRCFPTKAVQIWQRLEDKERGRLVALYARKTGRFDAAQLFEVSPRVTLVGVPPDERLRRLVASGEVYTDPLHAVIAQKKRSHAAG